MGRASGTDIALGSYPELGIVEAREIARSSAEGSRKALIHGAHRAQWCGTMATYALPFCKAPTTLDPSPLTPFALMGFEDGGLPPAFSIHSVSDSTPVDCVHRNTVEPWEPLAIPTMTLPSELTAVALEESELEYFRG
jgi:hypothetical protein